MVGFALLILMVIVTGPGTVFHEVVVLAAVSQWIASYYYNESLRALVPGPVGIAIAAMTALLTLVMLALRRHGNELLGACCVLCVMLLISPLVWPFYEIWLLLVACACLSALPAPQGINWRSWAPWLALTMLYISLAWSVYPAAHVLATLGLWVMSGWLYWRSAAGRGERVEALQPISVTA